MAELRLTLPSYRYPGAAQDALGAVDLRFARGGFSALVGPSGTGKSTLLHLLAGLRPIANGQLTGLQDTERQALMFQNPRLMPWLSVRDNLALVGDGSEQHRQRSDQLLLQTGLAERGDDYPGALSGGMQRRAALARAFSVAPQLLLMDEPFVSLDEPTAAGLRQLLLQLFEAARPTVVFVTHNLDEALQLADSIHFLTPSPGRVVLQQRLDSPRPRATAEVQQLRESLLRQHPQLLRGALGP